MRTGLYVLCVFAALWGGVALYALGAPQWTWIGPSLISLAVALYVGPRIFGTGDRSPGDRRRIVRVVATWSGVEVVAMLMLATLLPAIGQTRLVTPAATLVVALHFLPLARFLPYRPYYATGFVMSATSLLAMLAPGDKGPMLAAAGASAVILWASGLNMLRLVGASPPASAS